jgi:hypothetical protein
MAAFELGSVQIFKINLDQTVAVYNNNLDCKGLNFVYTYLFFNRMWVVNCY